MKVETKQKKGQQPPLMARLIPILVLLLLLLLGGLLAWRHFRQPRDYLSTAVTAQLGQLEGKTEAQIQAELDRVVEEGSMNISINTNPVFATGTAEGTLQIENSPANHYPQTVVISLDDTGEIIYESGLIEPNYHIQNDILLVDLEPGDYPATALFTAYDNSQDQNQLGQAVAKITITVIG